MTRFKRDILDHGSLEVLDIMGTDESIAEAARVSYAQNSNKSTTEKLIRYLMKHHHTSPFEMCEVKFQIKMPIFIARQWMRHRTANVNEISGRYSELEECFYNPEEFKEQSLSNKQGSAKPLNDPVQKTIQDIYSTQCKEAFKTYQFLLKNGVSREQARMVLPLSTYTTIIWKIDLHNLLNFIYLRTPINAQEEIRGYAEALLDFCSIQFPITTKAFQDYRLNSKVFTEEQINIVRKYTKNKYIKQPDTLSVREYNEVYDTFFGVEETV